MQAILATDSLGQLLTVFLIFVFVLFITAFTTKWIVNFQKEKSIGENITVVEAKKIAPNKLIEIVKIGNDYFALALGKDEVSVISKLEEDSLIFPQGAQEKISFKEFFKKARDDGDNNN